MQITNKLSDLRRRSKMTASELADAVGISRQTIYAVEAGTYIPNTAVALRLAQTLGVTVEELFSLSEKATVSEPVSRKVTLLPAAEELQPGQSVQVWQANGKLLAASSSPVSWFLPASDASIGGNVPVRGAARVHLHQPDIDFESRILLAGCDPAMGLVASHMGAAGLQLVLLHQNSSQSLALLKRGCAHLAGSHLRSETAGDTNVVAVNRLFPSKSAAIVSFAVWQEGLATATANPKHITGIHDLTRKDVSFVNREAGSGTRALLDRYLKRMSVDSKKIPGYSRAVLGHLAAAWEVKAGHADCCLTTEACARSAGVNFIPIESVRYDLVIRKQNLASPRVQLLLDVLNQSAFRRKLNAVGGYNTSVTGSRIQ